MNILGWAALSVTIISIILAVISPEVTNQLRIGILICTTTISSLIFSINFFIKLSIDEQTEAINSQTKALEKIQIYREKRDDIVSPLKEFPSEDNRKKIRDLIEIIVKIEKYEFFSQFKADKLKSELDSMLSIIAKISNGIIPSDPAERINYLIDEITKIDNNHIYYGVGYRDIIEWWKSKNGSKFFEASKKFIERGNYIFRYYILYKDFNDLNEKEIINLKEWYINQISLISLDKSEKSFVKIIEKSSIRDKQTREYFDRENLSFSIIEDKVCNMDKVCTSSTLFIKDNNKVDGGVTKNQAELDKYKKIWNNLEEVVPSEEVIEWVKEIENNNPYNEIV